MQLPNQPKFPLGRIVATQNALNSIHPDDIQEALERHCVGDWGAICDEDRSANEDALLNGSRLFSAYDSRSGVRFWLISERDRSATTLLLPSDY